MLTLLENQQYQTFALLLFTLIISLSCHEFAHAATAKYFGDRTAEQQGRLTLNPISHISPLGLLMIIMAGFGWAKPVPTTPRNFNSKWATPLIAAAGPFTNLLLAFLVANIAGLASMMNFEFASSPAASQLFHLMVLFNLVLMLLNLIPLGPLDGHYILPYFLSSKLAPIYEEFNAKYGGYALIALFMLSFSGLPVFDWMWNSAYWLQLYMPAIGA